MSENYRHLDETEMEKTLKTTSLAAKMGQYMQSSSRNTYNTVRVQQMLVLQKKKKSNMIFLCCFYSVSKTNSVE